MKLIFTKIFILSFSIIFAQGLNEVLLPAYPDTRYKQVLVEDNEVLMFGTGFDAPAPGNAGVVISKFDSSAAHIQSHYLRDSSNIRDHVFATDFNWGGITKTDKGEIAVTTATVYKESAFLLKFNEDLDLRLTKEYPDTVNRSNFRYTPLKAKDGFILYGANQLQNLKRRGFVHYTDSEGEIIWTKYFDGAETIPQSVKPVNDSSFVMAIGYENNSGDQKIEYYSFDLKGDFTKNWETDWNPALERVLEIVPLPDGGLIVHGMEVTRIIFDDYKLYSSVLLKYNKDFDVVWHKITGAERSGEASDQFNDLQLLNDNELIGCGLYLIPITVNVSEYIAAWVAKFSVETGDSIWQKIIYPSLPKSLNNGGRLLSIGELSSGNLMAGGYAWEGRQNYAWMVKLTPDGCLDTLDCEPTSTLADEKNKSESKIQVFPNPANSQLTVQFSPAHEVRRINIYDIRGQLLQEVSTGSGASEVVLDLSNFPNGVYILQTTGEQTENIKIQIMK